MKKTVLCLAIVSLLALGGPAIAELCTVDAVPAATLLLPYFEVDLDNDQGITTLFSVNNASAAPVLAHVTLWTDWTIATIDFDVYLTGYDVQSFNVRDIFKGQLPQTSPTLSNQGAYSFPNTLPPGCTEPGDLPIGNLPQSLIDLITQAHTGQSVLFPGFDGACAGQNYGDNIARGYITIDVVQTCSVQFPNSPGYFDTIAGFDNVLWGDQFIVDPTNDFAQGNTLVHVEAGGTQTFAPGDYTFYGRYVSGLATDRREPLGTTYATRYLNGGAFDGGTDIICWRDSKANPSPVACGGVPGGLPLGQEQVVIFDEEENPELPPPPPPISPVPPGEGIVVCPWETQRVEVGGPQLPVSFDFGWLYLNMNFTQTFGPTAGLFGDIAQAHIQTVMSAEGRYSVGFDAIQLDSACDGTNIVLPVIN